MPNGEETDAKKIDPTASKDQVAEVEKESEVASPQEPDWKELVREERERRVKAESDRDNYREGMLKYKGITKKKNREEEVVEDDDKPITRTELREVLREAVAPLHTESKLEGILSSMIADPSKRDYVRELYANRIQRTGNSDEAIRTDLETALAIADSKRVLKENAELKRSMENRNVYVPPTDGGGTADRGITKKAHQWTPEQETSLETRARMLGISDIEKYKESTWREFQAGTAFAVKPKGR